MALQRLAVHTLLALLLVAINLSAPPSALGLSLPWSRANPSKSDAPGPPEAPALQEVSPPQGVQQLQPLFSARQPRIRILEPTDGQLLPDGPWPLRLEVRDWPLMDAGDLGLGPHLVVQLDDAPPLRLTSDQTTMAPLPPGSHRLSVFAALPWGEALRSPGSFAQIRLHRTAANPLVLPEVGSPQLIPVLPTVTLANQPLLLDWMVVDAPLQHLRSGDDSWRLQVQLDEASLLLDHEDPLWLRGLPPGRHALRLDLLDPRGRPLNPPFNSLVRELDLSDTEPPPAWLDGSLSGLDQARLSGATPPANATGTPSGAAAPQPAPDGAAAGADVNLSAGEPLTPAGPGRRPSSAEPEPLRSAAVARPSPAAPSSPDPGPDPVSRLPPAAPDGKGDTAGRPTRPGPVRVLNRPDPAASPGGPPTPQAVGLEASPNDTRAGAPAVSAPEPSDDNGLAEPADAARTPVEDPQPKGPPPGATAEAPRPTTQLTLQSNALTSPPSSPAEGSSVATGIRTMATSQDPDQAPPRRFETELAPRPTTAPDGVRQPRPRDRSAEPAANGRAGTLNESPPRSTPSPTSTTSRTVADASAPPDLTERPSRLLPFDPWTPLPSSRADTPVPGDREPSPTTPSARLRRWLQGSFSR